MTGPALAKAVLANAVLAATAVPPIAIASATAPLATHLLVPLASARRIFSVIACPFPIALIARWPRHRNGCAWRPVHRYRAE
jgi:hypothetical protein